MQTKLYTMTETSPDRQAIEAWRGCPAGGRLVAFPTETVYGWGRPRSTPPPARGFRGQAASGRTNRCSCHLFRSSRRRRSLISPTRPARSCAAIRRGR